jgi:hypothetical protein
MGRLALILSALAVVLLTGSARAAPPTAAKQHCLSLEPYALPGMLQTRLPPPAYSRGWGSTRSP